MPSVRVPQYFSPSPPVLKIAAMVSVGVLGCRIVKNIGFSSFLIQATLRAAYGMSLYTAVELCRTCTISRVRNRNAKIIHTISSVETTDNDDHRRSTNKRKFR